jgi:hypothetical protein
MKPGSIQFRKHCENILPQRGGEQKAQYIARLARHLGFTTSRMTVLYYDQRKDNARFTPDEYTTIFLRNSTGSTPSQNQIIEANNRDLEELKQIKAQIKREIINELVTGLSKLMEARA